MGFLKFSQKPYIFDKTLYFCQKPLEKLTLSVFLPVVTVSMGLTVICMREVDHSIFQNAVEEMLSLGFAARMVILWICSTMKYFADPHLRNDVIDAAALAKQTWFNGGEKVFGIRLSHIGSSAAPSLHRALCNL